MDKISQALGTATGVENDVEASTNVAPYVKNEVIDLPDKYQEIKNNLGEDYDFARSNLRKVLEHAMSLLPNAISLAREAESPRIYESTSVFIKTIADINKDLLEISERNLKQGSGNNKINSPQEQSGVVNNNAIFVGTTDDLFAKLLQVSNVIDDGSF